MTDANTDTSTPFDCGGDPTAGLIEMFVRLVQEGRIKRGQRPAERPVFRKIHGTAHGRLEICADAPDDLRVGVFTHDVLDVWMRFSSDAAPTDPDLKSTLGVAIKAFGVPGRKATGEDCDTADFILQNHPVFFVDDARAMCEFTYAGVVGGDYTPYLDSHPATTAILDAMQKVEGSVLTSTYWALLPFHVGEAVVKYRLEPETPPQNVANRADDYLATDLANRLLRDDYCFRLMAQRRTAPHQMPLDQATVDWPESESPYVQLATLVIPRQDVTTLGQAEYGQALDFNVFRLPPENAPVAESSIAAVRKAVYAASAAVRHKANGQPQTDLPDPRAIDPAPARPDDRIVKAAIYPSIGIARVGNSPDGWFVGPEVRYPEPMPAGCYRDASGALKRQAARFRLYGLNVRGEIVRELTGEHEGDEISWQVELANTKAAWYGFQLALDIPEAASAPPTTLRNGTVADRTQLTIRPGPRTVAGRGAGPERFDDGTFMGRSVYLGEIFTDENGRLLVLGGHGVSASHDGSLAITFANNEGWFDDVSDGPVTAEVTIDGKPIDVLPAWVVVAPPNYGPGQKSVRTMWDLMRDVAVTASSLPRPKRPSFTDDILPIFERLSHLQWVNGGFAAAFGWEGALDLTSPDAVARLADPGPATAEFRHTIANAFRRHDVDAWSPKPWPWLYGDAMNLPTPPTPRAFSTLSDLQLSLLDQWAKGDFDADYDPDAEPVREIAAVPLAEQGDMLTRAALEFCLADAFHPGCEMTWPVRSKSLYMAPFRFSHAPAGWIAPTLGAIWSSDNLTLENGPLFGQQAGDITRWMAVPWQTDTASCRGGYDKAYDPYAPTFWPARVPNDVLTKENYAIVMDADRPLDERRKAFADRVKWYAPLGGPSYTAEINAMITGFGALGVVAPLPGPTDTDAFPDVIEVEDQHGPLPAPASATRALMLTTHPHAGAPAPRGELDLTGIEKVRRFPHGLPVQLK
jgi:L-Lysine epsilon oxidase N-terminal/L-lysine epsilon oxidase C-terminal domain